MSLRLWREGAWMSFWKLSSQRRELLLWRPLARILGATQYEVRDQGAGAEIHTPHYKYSYEIVQRSAGSLKIFRRGSFNQATCDGRYTIVYITISPPLSDGEGVTIHLPEPPTVVRSFPTYTTVAVLSSGYSVARILDACLAPYKMLQALRSCGEFQLIETSIY